MQVRRIDDLADPALGDYRGVRDPQLLRESGVFLAEGRTVLRLLLEHHPARVRSILGSETTHAWLVEQGLSIPADVTFHLAGDGVLRELTGYRFHQGCLAAALRPDVGDLATFLERHPPGPAPWVVLEDVSNPDNVGAIMRSARALRAGGVLLSRGCASPLYRKALRAGLGAALVVPWWQGEETVSLLAALHARGIPTWALTPAPDAVALETARGDHVGPGPALLLGSEGHGLRASTLEAATTRVVIPIDPRADSLNVAATAAIALYRLGGAV
jgi:tRNA G18 (ribose-2'-O)-methylase SpoU